MQCVALEAQLKAASQETAQLRAQISAFQLAAGESRTDASDSNSLAVQEEEMGSLRLKLQQRQQEIAELHLQLEASTQVSNFCITPRQMSQVGLLALLESNAHVCSGEWHVVLKICAPSEKMLALLAIEKPDHVIELLTSH